MTTLNKNQLMFNAKLGVFDMLSLFMRRKMSDHQLLGLKQVEQYCAHVLDNIPYNDKRFAYITCSDDKLYQVVDIMFTKTHGNKMWTFLSIITTGIRYNYILETNDNADTYEQSLIYGYDNVITCNHQSKPLRDKQLKKVAEKLQSTLTSGMYKYRNDTKNDQVIDKVNEVYQEVLTDIEERTNKQIGTEVVLGKVFGPHYYTKFCYGDYTWKKENELEIRVALRGDDYYLVTHVIINTDTLEVIKSSFNKMEVSHTVVTSPQFEVFNSLKQYPKEPIYRFMRKHGAI